jgi:hypothetical protein
LNRIYTATALLLLLPSTAVFLFGVVVATASLVWQLHIFLAVFGYCLFSAWMLGFKYHSSAIYSIPRFVLYGVVLGGLITLVPLLFTSPLNGRWGSKLIFQVLSFFFAWGGGPMLLSIGVLVNATRRQRKIVS